MDLAKFRRDCGECTEEELVKAVAAIDPTVQTPDQAKAWIWFLIKRLLDTERYGLAGVLLQGEALFNPGPRAVQQLLHTVRSTQNLIVLGAAATGKAYTLICYVLLDWIRDPEYTEIKVISETTGGHAKSQSSLDASASVQGRVLSPFRGSRWMALWASIQRIDTVRSRLSQYHKGKTAEVFCRVSIPFHELPPILFSEVCRGYAHCWMKPKRFQAEFGKVYLTSWRPPGGAGGRQGCVATNPRDVTSKLAQLAEPANGWTTISLDTDKTWVSSERWNVLRLDRDRLRKCDRAQHLVYPGFLTWDGYTKFAQELGGQSPKWLTFGRGMYPLSALQNTLIPYSLLEEVIGNYLFTGRTIGCAGIDLASDGGDRIVIFAGRYGNAIGFQPVNGKPTLWAKPRYCIQCDQYFELPPEKTIALATSIERKLKALNIHPDWTTCDRTGMGTGAHDVLQSQWSGSVRGVVLGSDAGNRKILTDDHDAACEVLEGLHTEMYVRVRKNLEFGFMAFHPQIPTAQLFKELSGRRYQPSAKGPSGKPRIRLEPKKNSKSALAASPDIADALVMMCHGCALDWPPESL